MRMDARNSGGSNIKFLIPASEEEEGEGEEEETATAGAANVDGGGGKGPKRSQILLPQLLSLSPSLLLSSFLLPLSLIPPSF